MQRIYSIDKQDVLIYSPVYDVRKILGEKNAAQRKSDGGSLKFNDFFDNIKDFEVYIGENDYVIVSPMRNITMLFKNLTFQNKVNHREAVSRMMSVVQIIKETDVLFSPKSAEDTEGFLYLDTLKRIHGKMHRKETEENSIREKQEAKNAAKRTVRNRWFRIGAEYVLKKTDISGETVSTEEYKCVKFIYTVGKNPVNCVVMKKNGEALKGDIRPLSVTDCHMFHIKYEPGLYMFPMNQKFCPKDSASGREGEDEVVLKGKELDEFQGEVVTKVIDRLTTTFKETYTET